MPAVNFIVRWPDGDTVEYYSPSTIIHEHLSADAHYPMDAFAEICERAMQQASERVRQRYGFACSASAAEWEKIRHKLKTLRRNGIQGDVSILALH